MSKRILAALICLPLALAACAAQLTATLQSGDNLTPFYGVNAFVDAYNAATDGDVITLSPGSFNSTQIEKGITIVGAYAFGTDASKSTTLKSFTIMADNVSIEGISVQTLSIKGADNLTIDRSHITTLDDEENGEKKYHDNTIVTNCLIDKNQAMLLSKNTVLRNCCIYYFFDVNESQYPALIENCNIPVFAYGNGNNVFDDFYKQPYAIYRNCFLGLYNKGNSSSAPVLNLNSPCEFHSVIFFQNFCDSASSSYSKSWTINFNSCVTDNVVKQGTKYSVGSALSDCKSWNSFSSYTIESLTVGPNDVKEEPAIPAIISSEIDTETDAEGNLHVKISAKARD